LIIDSRIAPVDEKHVGGIVIGNFERRLTPASGIMSRHDV
jgi:hypothetical protein